MATFTGGKSNESSTFEPYIKKINGFPLVTAYKKDIMDEIFDYMPHDDDIIIAGYPKTGNTWLTLIVHQILNAGELISSSEFYKWVNFIEFHGTSHLDNLAGNPRVYRHHLPYNMLKRNPKSKIIYIYRKPEDAFVSCYYFNNGDKCPIDFNRFFEDFLSGNKPYGQYIDHVLSYIEHKDDKNILLISYEKLHSKRSEEILRLAKFLGNEYYNAVVENERVLKMIIKHTNFDYMKKNFTFDFSDISKSSPELTDFLNKLPTKDYNFIRKGKIGDGKNNLNDSQLFRLRQLVRKAITHKHKHSDILKEWLEDS